MAVLMGIGLVSRKQALKSGTSSFSIPRALVIFPSNAKEIILLIKTGQIFEATDTTPSPPFDQIQTKVVVAGKNRKPFRPSLDHLFHLQQIAAGFLDAYDIGAVVRQSDQRVRIDVHPGSPLDVVQNARDVDAVGDRLEMKIKPLCVGLL